MDREAFLTKVRAYHDGRFRLVMINATALKPGPDVVADGCEIIWTFEHAGQIENLRERVTAADEVPSISSIYGFAYLYENEIRDLFGLNVTGISVDWKGQLYSSSTKVPFSPKAIRERLEAKGKKS